MACFHGNSHVTGLDVVVNVEGFADGHVEILHVVGAAGFSRSVGTSLDCEKKKGLMTRKHNLQLMIFIDRLLLWAPHLWVHCCYGNHIHGWTVVVEALLLWR